MQTEESAKPSRQGKVWVVPVDQGWSRGENRRMKGQSEIAYLPKFANMMLIVMVIMITEILYIILIFDCFENQ